MLAAIPSSHVSWSDPRLRGTWLALALALLVALAFLPSTMINVDEAHYAGQSRALLHGRLVPIDGDPFPAPPAEGEAAVRYPIGWPVLLAPAAAVGLRTMYLVALGAHLFGGALVGRLLVRRGVPSWLTAVYLFHPLFWSFSRTLMSDLPTAVLLLAAIDAWEERKPVRGALAVGYLLLMRSASLVTIAGFGLAIARDVRARRRDVVLLAGAAAAAIVAYLVVNHATHGNPIRYEYATRLSQRLDGTLLGENLLFYGAGLLVLPPFPLLCLVARFRQCDRWALCAIPILLVCIVYSYRDESPRWWESLVGGQRLALSAHAVLLVATAAAWWEAWSRLPIVRAPAAVLAGGALVGIVGCLMMKRLERRYGDAADAMAQCHPEQIGFNEYASRSALSVPAAQYHCIDDRDPTATGADVVLIAEQFTSNRAMVPIWPYTVPESLSARAKSCRRIGEFRLYDLTGGCPPPTTPCDVQPTGPLP